MSALQIAPFLTNKPNFLDDQMNVTSFIITNYEQRTMNYVIKNKAKTNPIQTQYKANSKSIRTQFKPKQTQFVVNLPPMAAAEGIEPISEAKNVIIFNIYQYFQF
jgi:hypothetical protein